MSLKSKIVGFAAVVYMLCVACLSVRGQSSIAIGQWRVHYPSASTHSVAVVGDKIFSASNVLLYYFDYSDNSLNNLSKKDGLTGAVITKLGVNALNNELLIGYADGNIDLLKEGVVAQFDDIQRSTILGSKKINHFNIDDNIAFVATDYGMSIINLKKKEVIDSYINVSSDGSANPFYASVLSDDKDSIYVVSAKGVLAARYSNAVNLKDFTNWKLYTAADGLPVGANKAIGSLNGNIYVGVNDQGLYYFNGTSWQATVITGTTGLELRSITSSAQGYLLATVDDKVYKILSPVLNETYIGTNMKSPNDAVIDNMKGDLWFSDKSFGLVHYEAGQTYVTAPNSPYTTDVYRIKYLNNQIAACSGGLNTAFGPLYIDGGAMLFNTEDNQWANYTRYDVFPDSRDILDIAYQSVRKKWYFSSFNYGLIEWDGISFNVYNTGNSPLKSDQVTGLATTSDGKLWLGNTSMNTNDPFLYSIDKNGSWSAYIPFQNTGKYPLDIAIDQQSRKWIRLSTSGGQRGMMLFDEKTNSQIYFTESSGAGALPNKSVNAIEIDNNGQVWLGTDEGVAVFTNPSQIKPGSVIPDVYLPIVDGFPLFFDKKINCIKVDGGNRKWIGTPDGAFLLSADGLETIRHFNAENSPLGSDNITTIEIDEKSGEVFFGTDNGIISYRGDATKGTEVHEDVKVFPNPVLPNFDGVVGVSGLVDGAVVKITDTAGKLTYETRANGGTATWNLKSYNGRRASAGIYLIFSASEDGAEKFVGKVAILE